MSSVLSEPLTERTPRRASPANPTEPHRRVRARSRDSIRSERAAHARFLRARYGPRWRDLPATLGRSLVDAEALLASGPIVIATTTSPTETIRRAHLAARAAAAMGALAHDEGEVLEQALGARVADLPLHRLAAVVEAVLTLGTAPRPEPEWASPVAAQAAAALLDACHDEFRAGARTHQALYAQFDDGIWELPARRLRNGRRPWRPIAWLRLRRALAASSRTRLAPAAVADAAALVLEGRKVRVELSSIAPLLANHLGEHDRGPLTDVDAARDALAAVRFLHDALGDRLDADRLRRLLAADAFRHDAVIEPARNLRIGLQAWIADVARLGGGTAMAMRGAELIDWAARIDEMLPTVEQAAAVLVRGAGPASTMRDLVYDLLVRERFSELTKSRATPFGATPVGTTS